MCILCNVDILADRILLINWQLTITFFALFYATFSKHYYIMYNKRWKYINKCKKTKNISKLNTYILGWKSNYLLLTWTEADPSCSGLWALCNRWDWCYCKHPDPHNYCLMARPLYARLYLGLQGLHFIISLWRRINVINNGLAYIQCNWF